MDTQTLGHHSPDGLWWWSGSEWLPAWSADRQWWFNGTVWTHASRSRTALKPSAVEFVMAGAWFLIWVLALVWAAAAIPASNAGSAPSEAIKRGGLTLLVGSTVLLPACGYLLAHSGRWIYLAALTLYVWVLLLAWYIGAMLMAPAADGSDNDTAAGAGLVILGVPGLIVIAALVGLGAAIGAAVRAQGRRRRRQALAPVG